MSGISGYRPIYTLEVIIHRECVEELGTYKPIWGDRYFVELKVSDSRQPQQHLTATSGHYKFEQLDGVVREIVQQTFATFSFCPDGKRG